MQLSLLDFTWLYHAACLRARSGLLLAHMAAALSALLFGSLFIGLSMHVLTVTSESHTLHTKNDFLTALSLSRCF